MISARSVEKLMRDASRVLLQGMEVDEGRIRRRKDENYINFTVRCITTHRIKKKNHEMTDEKRQLT